MPPMATMRTWTGISCSILQLNTWTKAAPALSKRNSASGAVINGLWHVVGGRGVTSAGRAMRTRSTIRGKTVADGGADAEGSGARCGITRRGALGGALYVFGGEYFDNGWRVHPEALVLSRSRRADAWTAATPMPTPRHGLGAVIVDDTIWLVGGAKKPSGSDTARRGAVLDQLRLRQIAGITCSSALRP